MRRALPALLAVSALLAACTGSAPAALPPVATPSVAPPVATPSVAVLPQVRLRISELVGDWRLQARGDTATHLRVEPTQLTVRRACGDLSGYWVALPSGQFTGRVRGAEIPCTGTPDWQRIPWLAEARALRPDGTGWRLLDDRGATVATLVPGTLPERPEDRYRSATPLTDKHRAFLDRVLRPLPDGVAPATADDLAGRWVTGRTGDRSFAQFEADGEYLGSDGCNGVGASWVTDGAGSVLITQFFSTLVGCDGTNIPRWFSGTRVSRQGDSLVFYDGAGNRLHELVRG